MDRREPTWWSVLLGALTLSCPEGCVPGVSVRRKHHEDKKEHKETREKDKMRRVKFIPGGWVEWSCDFAKFVDA